MGNQVAPVMAVRKSPPPNCDSGLREKRLYHSFMLVLANIGITWKHRTWSREWFMRFAPEWDDNEPARFVRMTRSSPAAPWNRHSSTAALFWFGDHLMSLASAMEVGIPMLEVTPLCASSSACDIHWLAGALSLSSSLVIKNAKWETPPWGQRKIVMELSGILIQWSSWSTTND